MLDSTEINTFRIVIPFKIPDRSIEVFGQVAMSFLFARFNKLALTAGALLMSPKLMEPEANISLKGELTPHIAYVFP